MNQYCPIALVLLMLFHLAFVDAEILQKKNVELDAFRYLNRAHNFTLNLPKSWRLTEGKDGTAVMAIRPAETLKEIFLENISVVVQRTRPGIGISELFKESIPQLKKSVFGFYLIEKGITKLGRGEGGWMLYGFENNQRSIKLLQNFIIINGHTYTVTGAATATNFSKYRPVFQAIADSLVVNE